MCHLLNAFLRFKHSIFDSQHLQHLPFADRLVGCDIINIYRVSRCTQVCTTTPSHLCIVEAQIGTY